MLVERCSQKPAPTSIGPLWLGLATPALKRTQKGVKNPKKNIHEALHLRAKDVLFIKEDNGGERSEWINRKPRGTQASSLYKCGEQKSRSEGTAPSNLKVDRMQRLKDRIGFHPCQPRRGI